MSISFTTSTLTVEVSVRGLRWTTIWSSGWITSVWTKRDCSVSGVQGEKVTVSTAVLGRVWSGRDYPTQ